MEYIKFNKSLCGVDFLMNVLQYGEQSTANISNEIRSTDFFQIVFVQEVQGNLLLNENKIALHNNSILFISKHQHHQWQIDTKRFKAHLLVFQDEFLNDFFADAYFTYRLLYFYQTQFPLTLDISDTELRDYLSNLNEIKQELLMPQTDSAHLIRSILYNILIRLNRSYSKKNQIESAISTMNQAYEFRKLVEQHIATRQRIEDYTELMKMSRISLNKMVKQQFNITASEFIKTRLLFEIKMKLIYTQMSISEIANAYHFSEANHLSRLFKQKEGVTPMEYRRNYQNGSH